MGGWKYSGATKNSVVCMAAAPTQEPFSRLSDTLACIWRHTVSGTAVQPRILSEYKLLPHMHGPMCKYKLEGRCFINALSLGLDGYLSLV